MVITSIILSYIKLIDLLFDIKDPEFPNTLEELGVISENNIKILGTFSHIWS